jgi:hypothetical protein
MAGRKLALGVAGIVVMTGAFFGTNFLLEGRLPSLTSPTQQSASDDSAPSSPPQTGDEARVSQVKSIASAIRRYRTDHGGAYPPASAGTAYCLGVDENKNCWRESSTPVKGNDALNASIQQYTKISLDPAANRSLGDAYLYMEGTQIQGCSSTAPKVNGHFLLWIPEKPLDGSANACFGAGFASCCSPHCTLYCAYSLDQ